MSDRQNLPRPAPEVIEDAGDAYLDQQVLEPGAGGLGDEEPDALGEVDMGLEVAVSPEEAAMRVVDEPPGMNYDPDPGYVDNDQEATS
ncbi:MAG TPA: hypothetical protein VFK43_08375 [Acidimicrobiales bacterium]|nr:hypothetical protein [Acidimicrobiales bacterium]